jgi:hypothetical protein
MGKYFKLIFLLLSLGFSPYFSLSQDYNDISDILPSKIILKEDYTIVVNGEKIFPDVPPVEYQGIVFVPLRFVSGALGAEIFWINEKKEVKIKTKEKEVIFKIGDLKTKQNNRISSLIAPPFVYRGRTMIPLKWTAKSLGADVKEKKNSMEISYKLGISNFTSKEGRPPSEVLKISSQKYPSGVGWIRWRNFKVKVINLFKKELRETQNKAVGPIFLTLWIISVYLYLSSFFRKKRKKIEIEGEEEIENES